MAERRMFSKSIVLSDAFLDMPMSTRCLYFTLGMFADDDGFVNSPRAIIRQCGASDGDMKTLIKEKFVILFEDGVIVIKHWRINNYLQRDRYKETNYKEDKALLTLDENGSYHCELDSPLALEEHPEEDSMYTQNVYTQDVYTQDRLGKDSIGKVSIGEDRLNNNIIYIYKAKNFENLSPEQQQKAEHYIGLLDFVVNKQHRLEEEDRFIGLALKAGIEIERAEA